MRFHINIIKEETVESEKMGRCCNVQTVEYNTGSRVLKSQNVNTFYLRGDGRWEEENTAEKRRFRSKNNVSPL